MLYPLSYKRKACFHLESNQGPRIKSSVLIPSAMKAWARLLQQSGFLTICPHSKAYFGRDSNPQLFVFETKSSSVGIPKHSGQD